MIYVVLAPKIKRRLPSSSIVQLSGLSYNKSTLFRLKDGQLAWGTNNGAIFFEPQSIREVLSKGKIFFQDLTISGTSIRETPSFKLIQPLMAKRPGGSSKNKLLA